jgi:predicted outer membrane lipoprotein
MNFKQAQKVFSWRAGILLAAAFLVATMAVANEHERTVFVLTSTNSTSGNQVVVLKLDAERSTPSLSLVSKLPTGGKGGASTNAGILQFKDDLGAVANYGSNSVSQLARLGDAIFVVRTLGLAPKCVKPDSVALTDQHLFVVGANCAESHAWPAGNLDGSVVNLPDASAAQIAVGKSWGAVTLASGSVLQLPLNQDGALSGTANTITLPSNANNTPLGAAFWGDNLGFTPAHSPDSFAIVNEDRNVFPIAGPTPSFPTNAPCWVAKGPGGVWYTGNSPGLAISIFFTDGQGGIFYKSIPLPGSPTDITVSHDGKWLAVIYTVGTEGYVSVFSIDAYGDLTLVTASSAIGVPSFSGVAFSQ